MQFSAILDRILWNYCVKTGIVLLGKDSPPPPPSAKDTANAQLQTNIGTAEATTALGHSNTVGPTGSTTWTQAAGTPGAQLTAGQAAVAPTYDADNHMLTPGSAAIAPTFSIGSPGQWTQTNTLGPDQQANLDTQNAMTRSVSAGLQQPMDYGTMPDRVGSIGNNLPAMGTQPQSQGVNNVAEALYHKQTAMLDPQYQQSDAALASKLANQGITAGSAAYNTEMGNQSRNKDFAYGNARDSAILAGGAEDTRQFNQGLAGSEFANQSNQQAFGQQQAAGAFTNTARDQALSEAILKRNQPVNELNALKQGNQLTMPNFQGPGQSGVVNPVDYSGLVNGQYQAQVGATNASNAQTGQTEAALASLAAMIMMA